MGSWKSRPTCDSPQRGSRCRHRARGRGGGRESEMLARTPREPLALIVPVRPISPSVQQFWRASGVSRRRCGRAEAPRPPVAYTTRAPGDQRAHASCRAHGLPDLSPTITPGEPQFPRAHDCMARAARGSQCCFDAIGDCHVGRLDCVSVGMIEEAVDSLAGTCLLPESGNPRATLRKLLMTPFPHFSVVISPPILRRGWRSGVRALRAGR